MKKEYVCKECGKRFKDYISNGKRVFCSRKCMNFWVSKNLVGNERYNWKPKKYCIDCGKELSRRKYTRCIECSSKNNKHHVIHGLSDTRLYKRIYDKRARAKRKGAIGSHTLEEWQNLIKYYESMCLWCKKYDKIIDFRRGVFYSDAVI